MFLAAFILFRCTWGRYLPTERETYPPGCEVLDLENFRLADLCTAVSTAVICSFKSRSAF